MATPDIRTLVDQLKARTEQARAALSAAAAASRTPTNPLGLRFVTGDRVLDLTTGKRGLVIRGSRSPDLGVELFAVRLETGSLVYRQNAEIEPDPSPAQGV